MCNTGPNFFRNIDKRKLYLFRTHFILNDLVSDLEVELGRAFTPLLDLDPEDVVTMYNGFKEATSSAAERMVGFKRIQEVEGLTRSIEEACEQRHRVRIQIVSNPLSAEKRTLYKSANKIVKVAVKGQKQNQTTRDRP